MQILNFTTFEIQPYFRREKKMSNKDDIFHFQKFLRVLYKVFTFICWTFAYPQQALNHWFCFIDAYQLFLSWRKCIQLLVASILRHAGRAQQLALLRKRCIILLICLNWPNTNFCCCCWWQLLVLFNWLKVCYFQRNPSVNES